MSIRNVIVVSFAFSALTFMAGCGSSSNSATPPPTGRFGNSNLNGTYVFSFSGADAVNGTFFTVVGSFAANGSGGITSGKVDIVDPAYGVLLNQSVGSGSGYKITADGRGNGTLVTSSTSTPFQQVGIDFVLISSSHGLITRFDGNGTGSGTIDLQSSSVTQNSLRSYAFSLSGVDSFLAGASPFAAAGAFALDGSGNITSGSGLEDFNDAGSSSNLTELSLTGSVLVGSAGAPGTAQLTTSSHFGALSFDVWAIDATHLKLIETDGAQILEGDAFTQQTTISSGQLVFTIAGLDTGGLLLSSGGFMAYDGSSVIGPNGFEDINDPGLAAGFAQSSNVSGSLTQAPTGSGRYQLALTGFFNGTALTGSYTFAAYPSNSGILLMEIDNAGVSAGTAFPQTAQTFASAKGYGLNLSGANSNGEVDDIAEFTANPGGTLTNGLIDENDLGTLVFDQPLGTGGAYQFDSPSTGRGELSYPGPNNTFTGTLNLVFYVANNSTAIFIDADAGAQVGVGVFQLQNAPTSPTLALAHTQSHFSMLRTAAALRARRKN